MRKKLAILILVLVLLSTIAIGEDLTQKKSCDWYNKKVGERLKKTERYCFGDNIKVELCIQANQLYLETLDIRNLVCEANPPNPPF